MDIVGTGTGEKGFQTIGVLLMVSLMEGFDNKAL